MKTTKEQFFVALFYNLYKSEIQYMLQFKGRMKTPPTEEELNETLYNYITPYVKENMYELIKRFDSWYYCESEVCFKGDCHHCIELKKLCNDVYNGLIKHVKKKLNK